jgi:uncharacterized protein (DUF305 family)
MNHNAVNYSEMNHSEMSHSEMKSSAGAASAPYDLQFIDTMIAHHQSAVEMAEMVEDRTQNPELKKFAQQIITDQEKEISQMKDWRKEWFAGKPPALNMEMPGMADSMKMDMTKLSAAKDLNFDLAFIQMMTQHHKGAVIMAMEALTRTERPEIKTLAERIIKTQEAEIKMMNDWIRKAVEN